MKKIIPIISFILFSPFFLTGMAVGITFVYLQAGYLKGIDLITSMY